MKFLIYFALAVATLSARSSYSRLIQEPVIENEGRITNGQTATPGQFKYQVGLDFDLGSDLVWCGGSLLGNKWVLTTAHCTVDALWVEVYLGSTLREGPEKVHNVTVTEIFVHPIWNPSNLKNDIALIRIPATHESSNIGYVRIPSNNNNKYLRDSVVVTGWGITYDGSVEFSDVLKFAILKVSPGNVCFEKYGLFYSDDIQICVATPHKVSPCYGDSGGPLVLQRQNLQIGLVSFTETEECTKKMPIIFTRVSAYRLWIVVRTGIHY